MDCFFACSRCNLIFLGEKIEDTNQIRCEFGSCEIKEVTEDEAHRLVEERYVNSKNK